MLEPVRREFDRLRPLIERALARQSLYTVADVESALEEDRAVLWPGASSVIVTTLEDYPQGARVIQTWLAAGEQNEIVRSLRPAIEAEAAAAWGVSHVLIEGGRRGWERVLQPHGYRFEGVKLLKELGR